MHSVTPRKTFRNAAIAILAILVAFAAVGWAGNVELAETTRISERKVVGELAFANGSSPRFTTFEGEMVRFHLDEGKVRFGITPVIDDENQLVRFKVFRLALDHVREDGTQVESIYYQETLEIPIGARATLKSQPSTLDLSLISVSPPNRGSEKTRSNTKRADNCCVTCDGTESCSGCKVDDTCGSCCAGSCCDDGADP